ncbi:TIGR02452 family protein [Candidatus Uabimicrobium sp. HlEnr_7]|uniref:TIGR02452 family protein n=1 Tax=Candidatus Uabimicrobium helgolandensis TaxID=3095367 RepID=UPI003556D292
MNINRKAAAEIAEETMKIIERGYYIIDGENIFIGSQMQEAIINTCSYPPDKDPLEVGDIKKQQTEVTVMNETTLSATERLAEENFSVAALNFASAKNPGGGFRSGARAQEESLARSSALHPCIVNNSMYTFHRQRNNPFYSNYALYSPKVPVFKRDDGTLLKKPYLCSFITAPAVNAGAMRKRKSNENIREEMQNRIRKVLTIAAFHQNEAIVLGAWGCGVFRNDSNMIAELFHQELSSFSGIFAKVIFAVIDRSRNGQNIKPFYKLFPKGM